MTTEAVVQATTGNETRALPRLVRFIALAAVALLTAGLAGCSTTPLESGAPTGDAPAATSTPVATSTPAPTSASGLPDLGLTNVRTDLVAARSALITSAGGTISATDSNGAVYTLTLPIDAVQADTDVALYPVTSLANLPAGASLTAGVQFTPDGLHLRRPATLTIALPAGVDTSKLSGFAWGGDGDRELRYPTLVAGQTLTLDILHFSGAGVLGQEIPLVPLTCSTDPADLPCLTADWQAALAIPALSPGGYRSQLVDVLKAWYRQLVAPAVQASIQATSVTPLHPDAEQPVADAYDAWLVGIEFAREALHDPSFTVSPELGQSKDLAVAFLLDWYTAENAQCVAQQDNLNIATPFFWADAALSGADPSAEFWGIATTANRLDLATLLNDLCVQVVIDPSRSYSAVKPGENGTVSINAGFTIGSGPVRTAAGHPIHIIVILARSSEPVAEGDTDADGNFSATLTWPAGVNPIEIDILATLTEGALLTSIARFDRITKSAERLEFTFNTGLDGWSSGGAGPQGSSNWGVVGHLNLAGGVVHMNGRGSPSRPNSWIFRSFSLPSTTTSLSFDVSAELIAGSSSSVRVRIVAGGVSTPLPWTTVRNARNRLSFTRKSVDISRWAGQHVRIYIEQNDNTPAGSIGFDKEIYIDNVRIATS